MTKHSDHKIVKPDLIEIEDHEGNSIFISPLHPKYKEMKQLEESRKTNRS